MDRQSLAMQAEITQATQNYVKEIQAIRARHGFGRLTIELSSTNIGAKVACDIETELRLHFDEQGEQKSEPRPEKETGEDFSFGPKIPKPTPDPSPGTPIRKSEFPPPPPSSHHTAIINRLETEASTRPGPLPPSSEGIPSYGGGGRHC